MGIATKIIFKDRGIERLSGEGGATRHGGSWNLFFRKSCLMGVFLLSTALLWPMLSLADEVVFIANTDIPVSSLTRDEVKRIFLGKKTAWEDDGGKIVFAVQKKTDASTLFFTKYVGKSLYQYSIYWKKRVFTGKGKAPLTFPSDLELAAFVSKTPGAIGYVSAGTPIENVKTILVR